MDTSSRAGRHGALAGVIGVTVLLAGCSAVSTSSTPANASGSTGSTGMHAPASALSGAGLGYDPAGRRVLAFGDVSTTQDGTTTSIGVGAPTYAWAPPTGWTLLKPARAPSARSDALLADAAGRLLLVDGQVRASSTAPCPSSPPSDSPDGDHSAQGCSSIATVSGTRTPGDAWTWTGTTWTRTATRGLPPNGQSATTDPALHGVVLVGSTSRDNQVDFSRDVTGTWLLTDNGPRTWRLLSRTQPTGGQPAYDPHTRQLLAYTGNQAFTRGPRVGAPNRPGSNTTSVLMPTRWATVHGATAEDAGGVTATDPRTGRVVLLTELGHTFSWTGSTWQPLNVPGPTGTTGLPALVTDPADRLVLAVYTTGTKPSTWTFTGTWHQARGPTP